MQRRRFIRVLSHRAGFVLLAPSILAACSKEDDSTIGNGKSVVVIGAGISGLAAAKELKAKGFEVLVLEAQDRVGGRLRTNRSAGVAFDEGASWIHGDDGNPLTALAQEAGMTTAITDYDSSIFYDLGGVEIDDAVYQTTEAAYENILDTLKDNGSLTKSFEQVFLQAHPQYANDRLMRFFLSGYFTFDRGDLDKTSSLYYNEGEVFEGDELLSTNGYDTIPKYLAQGLNVQLNQRVSQIDYSGAKVKITHQGTTTEADYCLVTVPLGVLKKGVIGFTPTLPPTKQNAIDKVGMNCVNKFLLTFDTQFWGDEQFIFYTPEAKDKFNFFVNVKKVHPTVPALMTFAFAEYGRQTEAMTDAEVTGEIMAHLRDIYGQNIPAPTQLLRTKWSTNENSYGSYSFTAVETEPKHFDDLAQEVDQKLFFAGEHTEADYFSNAHGAYLSGKREAQKIIDLQ